MTRSNYSTCLRMEYAHISLNLLSISCLKRMALTQNEKSPLMININHANNSVMSHFKKIYISITFCLLVRNELFMRIFKTNIPHNFTLCLNVINLKKFGNDCYEHEICNITSQLQVAYDAAYICFTLLIHTLHVHI